MSPPPSEEHIEALGICVCNAIVLNLDTMILCTMQSPVSASSTVRVCVVRQDLWGSRWRYVDPSGQTQGPFPARNMLEWYRRGLLNDMSLQTCGAVSACEIHSMRLTHRIGPHPETTLLQASHMCVHERASRCVSSECLTVSVHTCRRGR